MTPVTKALYQNTMVDNFSLYMILQSSAV